MILSQLRLMFSVRTKNIVLFRAHGALGQGCYKVMSGGGWRRREGACGSVDKTKVRCIS